MPQQPDGVAAEPTVSHSNPVTQAGFTMIPNAVLLRGDLSIQARLVYAYLKHLAWRGGGDDEVDPPAEVIARDLDIGRNQVTKYIGELVGVGLVTSTRRGLGLPNSYVIHDPVIGDSGIPESVQQESPERGDLARAQDGGEPKTSTTQDEVPPPAPSSEIAVRRPANRPAKTDRKTVTDDEYELAAGALGAFNAEAGTRYASKEWIAKIVLRIREQPSLPLEGHARVIAHQLASPWWRGEPSPSVIYGNAALFERALHAAVSAGPGPGDRPLTPEEMATFGIEWGPGTPHATLREARTAQNGTRQFDLDADAVEVEEDADAARTA